MAKAATKPTPTEDEIIRGLLAKVEQKQAEIERAGRTDYKTNMSFSFSESKQQDLVPLNVCNDVKTFIKIAAFLMMQEDFFVRASMRLLGDGFGQLPKDHPKFTWCGFTLNQWLEDIQTRIAKIQVAARERELSVLEAELSELISPEERRRMKLEAIKARLGD